MNKNVWREPEKLNGISPHPKYLTPKKTCIQPNLTEMRVQFMKIIYYQQILARRMTNTDVCNRKNYAFHTATAIFIIVFTIFVSFYATIRYR